MLKLFKASVMEKNDSEHQLDKNKKTRKEKKIKPLHEKLFFSEDQKRMGKSLTKNQEKREKTSVSLTIFSQTSSVHFQNQH